MQPTAQYIHYNPNSATRSSVTTNVQHRQQAVAGSSSSTGVLQLTPTARANAIASGSTRHNISSTSILNMQPAKATTSKTSASSTPILATGDGWTKDLIHLAKTAELKKHALTLQLHTAHILSAYTALDEKQRGVQDVMEQKNKLESERSRLLTCLREVNEDRDKADIAHETLVNETNNLQLKITNLTAGEYAAAKADVDRLCGELGQPTPLSLQATLDERASRYLTDRRLTGNTNQHREPSPIAVSASAALKTRPSRTFMTARKSSTPILSTSAGTKRNAADAEINETNNNASEESVPKRSRGRPKGSKNLRKSMA